MDGEAQPAAAHISAMDTLLDYAHNEVTPLVECSHTPMGQCRPKEDRPRMTDFSGSKGGPFRALRTEGRSQVGIVKGRGGFILLDCLPHEAASRVACRCACILIGLICSPIGRCRLIKKIKKSDDCLAGRSIICPADFSSQVHGRKRAGGRKGLSRSLKRKLSVSAERRNSYPHSGDIPSW